MDNQPWDSTGVAPPCACSGKIRAHLNSSVCPGLQSPGLSSFKNPGSRPPETRCLTAATLFIATAIPYGLRANLRCKTILPPVARREITS
ncbi:MAG: hypothetical protein GF401_16295 [Chitinivibrionales bacterium]|nr:hypothetical protein [Chitinivibrionales bacterium]